MMFFEDNTNAKDADRPNCFEHYHPFHGKACLYRGIDDYQHSWIVDLILKYVVGVNIREDGEVFLDPLDFQLDFFEMSDITIQGKKYAITLKNQEWVLEKNPV